MSDSPADVDVTSALYMPHWKDTVQDYLSVKKEEEESKDSDVLILDPVDNNSSSDFSVSYDPLAAVGSPPTTPAIADAYALAQYFEDISSDEENSGVEVEDGEILDSQERPPTPPKQEFQTEAGGLPDDVPAPGGMSKEAPTPVGASPDDVPAQGEPEKPKAREASGGENNEDSGGEPEDNNNHASLLTKALTFAASLPTTKLSPIGAQSSLNNYTLDLRASEQILTSLNATGPGSGSGMGPKAGVVARAGKTPKSRGKVLCVKCGVYGHQYGDPQCNYEENKKAKKDKKKKGKK